MSKRNGTIDTICVEICQALMLLQDYLETPETIDKLLNELGYKLPESPTFLDEISHYFSIFVPNLNRVLESYENNTYNEPEFYIRLHDLIESLIHLIVLINELPEKIDQQYHSYADFLNNSGIKETFVLRLIDYLFINYFQKNQPVIFGVIALLGLVNIDLIQEGEYNPNYYLHKINWDYLTLLFSKPKEVFEKSYNWGKSEFNSDLLLDRIQNLFWSFGIGAEYESPNTQYLSVIDGVESNELFEKSELRVPIWYDIIELGENLKDFASYEAGLAFCPSSDQNIENNDGIAIRPFIEGELRLEIYLGSQWSLSIGSDVDISSGIGVVITPKTSIKIFNDIFSENPISDGKFEAKLERTEGDRFAILSFGGSNGSGIYLNDISITLQTLFIQDETEVVLELSLQKATVVISVGEGDGFLQKILPEEPIQLNFDFTLGISNKRGFYIKGGAGFEYLFRINKSIGPIFVNTVGIKLSVTNEELTLALVTIGGVELGPVTAVVQNMGMETILEFGKPGLLGNADLSMGFKLPDGIGISIDAQGVRGGGVLNRTGGLYVGAIELAFQDQFLLSAVGILTTRSPDGGYSLLMSINADFPTPIALGMNFYLSSVGGLIGLSRTVNIDALRQGVQADTLDNILFPTDVAKNIDTIVDDLQAVFPSQKGQFVIAPMALITWNNPPIVRIELGLLIEFPNPVRVAILGVLKSTIPSPENPLVVIQVNFLGVIDFQKKLLSFDASIYDSRIWKFSLEGDMALRLSWGEHKEFLLSVGGFHPAYTPPAFLNLPVMKRITINLMTGNPKVTLQSYYTITSNTVQFGASLDLYYKAGKLNLKGYLGFDALFQFSPFYFIANIKAGVAIRWGSKELLGVTLSLTLRGPTPWIIKGTAKIKIFWFFSIKVKINKTFGKTQQIPLPRVDVFPIFLQEIATNTHWQGALPENRFMLVKLRKAPLLDDDILVETNGTLTINQDLLPIHVTFDKFGHSLPNDVKNIDLVGIRVNGSSVDTEYVTNSFAPAFFKTMTDDDKLTAPSYVRMKSGLKVKESYDYATAFYVGRNVEYEIVTSDFDAQEDSDITCAPIHHGVNIPESVEMFEGFARGGAIGQSVLSKSLKVKRMALDRKMVNVAEEHFVIVHCENLRLYSEETNFIAENRAEAHDHLQELLTQHPELDGKLQIMPEYQVAEG